MPVNLTIIFGLVVAGLGVYMREWPTIAMAVGVIAITWFTSPRKYSVYKNALVVGYGQPRVKVVYFNQVDEVELLSLPLGDRIRVRLLKKDKTRGGRTEILQMRDPAKFRDRLQAALEDFRRNRASACERCLSMS